MAAPTVPRPMAGFHLTTAKERILTAALKPLIVRSDKRVRCALKPPANPPQKRPAQKPLPYAGKHQFPWSKPRFSVTAEWLPAPFQTRTLHLDHENAYITSVKINAPGVVSFGIPARPCEPPNRSMWAKIIKVTEKSGLFRQTQGGNCQVDIS